MQMLSAILLAISVFLCGTIAGMNLIDKMYKKNIEDSVSLIEEYEEMTKKLNDSNIWLTQIITDVLNENDYASGKYIKEHIKKTLGSAGKHKS